MNQNNAAIPISNESLREYKQALENSISNSNNNSDTYNHHVSHTRQKIRRGYNHALKNPSIAAPTSALSATNPLAQPLTPLDNIIKNFKESLRKTEEALYWYTEDFNNHLNKYGPVPGDSDTTLSSIKNASTRIINNMVAPVSSLTYSITYLLYILSIIITLPTTLNSVLAPTEQQASNINNINNNQSLLQYTADIQSYTSSLMQSALEFSNNAFSSSLEDSLKGIILVLIPLKVAIESYSINFNRAHMAETYRHHGLITSLTPQQVMELNTLTHNYIYKALTSIIPITVSLTSSLTREQISGVAKKVIEDKVQKSLLNMDSLLYNLLRKSLPESVLNSTELFNQVEIKVKQIINDTAPFSSVISGILSSGAVEGTDKIISTLIVPVIIIYIKMLSPISASPFDHDRIKNEIRSALKDAHCLPNSKIDEIMKTYESNLSAQYFSLPSFQELNKHFQETWKYGLRRYLQARREYIKNIIMGPSRATHETLENKRKAYQEITLGASLFHFGEFIKTCKQNNISEAEIRNIYAKICKEGNFTLFSFDDMKNMLRDYILQEGSMWHSPESNLSVSNQQIMALIASNPLNPPLTHDEDIWHDNSSQHSQPTTLLPHKKTHKSKKSSHRAKTHHNTASSNTTQSSSIPTASPSVVTVQHIVHTSTHRNRHKANSSINTITAGSRSTTHAQNFASTHVQNSSTAQTQNLANTINPGLTLHTQGQNSFTTRKNRLNSNSGNNYTNINLSSSSDSNLSH